MELYAVILVFADTISGTFTAKQCVCLATDKTLMEYRSEVQETDKHGLLPSTSL